MGEPWESFSDVMQGVSWQQYVRRKDDRIRTLEDELAFVEARRRSIAEHCLKETARAEAAEGQVAAVRENFRSRLDAAEARLADERIWHAAQRSRAEAAEKDRDEIVSAHDALREEVWRLSARLADVEREGMALLKERDDITEDLHAEATRAKARLAEAERLLRDIWNDDGCAYLGPGLAIRVHDAFDPVRRASAAPSSVQAMGDTKVAVAANHGGVRRMWVNRHDGTGEHLEDVPVRRRSAETNPGWVPLEVGRGIEYGLVTGNPRDKKRRSDEAPEAKP